MLVSYQKSGVYAALGIFTLTAFQSSPAEAMLRRAMGATEPILSRVACSARAAYSSEVPVAEGREAVARGRQTEGRIPKRKNLGEGNQASWAPSTPAYFSETPKLVTVVKDGDTTTLLFNDTTSSDSKKK